MSKELILNVDDLGLHLDTIECVEQLWENKRISTVSILSTSPIIDQTINGLKKIGIPCGVHLILDGDKPILEKSRISSIVNEQGIFFDKIDDIKNRLKPDEVFMEFSAQIENIKNKGIKISHLDSHKGLCFYIPKLRKVYRELGKKYKLPLALPKDFIFNKTRRSVNGSSDSLIGIYELKDEETLDNRLKAYEVMLSKLCKGKHYCFSHPSPPTKSIKKVMSDFKIRNNEYSLLLSSEWKKLLDKYEIKLVSF